MSVIKIIAHNVLGLRTNKKWTQEQLASLSDMSEKYLGKIERGEANPTIKKLESLCKALEISVEALITEHKAELGPDHGDKPV